MNAAKLLSRDNLFSKPLPLLPVAGAFAQELRKATVIFEPDVTAAETGDSAFASNYEKSLQNN